MIFGQSASDLCIVACKNLVPSGLEFRLLHRLYMKCLWVVVCITYWEVANVQQTGTPICCSTQSCLLLDRWRVFAVPFSYQMRMYAGNYFRRKLSLKYADKSTWLLNYFLFSTYRRITRTNLHFSLETYECGILGKVRWLKAHAQHF